MSIFNLAQASYWFGQPFIARGAVAWIWLVIFLAFILLGILARVMRVYVSDTPQKELWRRISNSAHLFGFLGLLWLFFRQERIPFLAWRFWLLLWLAGLVWTVYRLVQFGIKRLPAIRQEQWERARRERYLPRSKK